MAHYVYKYVYNNEIVYIGKNDTVLDNRIKQHTYEAKFQPYLSSDIYFIKLPNSIMADVLESELIRRYNPILNVAKKSEWSGLPFCEPEWVKFIPTKKTFGNRKNKATKTTLNQRTSQQEQTSILMTDYYLPQLLKNIDNVKETDKYYIIDIPTNPLDENALYCEVPAILYDDSKIHSWLTLGYIEHHTNYVSYVFIKNSIFQEFYNVPTGLKQRIQYMLKMYKKKC